jgi:hypothetical protein
MIVNIYHSLTEAVHLGDEVIINIHKESITERGKPEVLVAKIEVDEPILGGANTGEIVILVLPSRVIYYDPVREKVRKTVELKEKIGAPDENVEVYKTRRMSELFIVNWTRKRAWYVDLNGNVKEVPFEG